MLKLNFRINIWRILGLMALIAFAVIFRKVVIYVTISMVLFLLAYPITYKLERIRFGKRRMPDGLAALITILLIVGLILGLFNIIIPPLVTEIKFLSSLNFYDVMHNILAQFPSAREALLRLGNEKDLEASLVNHATQLLNTQNITSVVNNLFGYFGTIAGGILCVLFITFFFLKDEQIVKQGMLTITPTGLEGEMRDVFTTSKKMLSKYFAGLFIDMFIVITADMIGLSLLGIKNALLISFVAGIMNLVPYIGSMITMIIAIFLGVSGCISSESYDMIGPTINKIFFTLLSVNLIDGFVIQPLIFSNSVKAHPLEIFIVTLMAATIGGIPGMIVALPAYTLIRIVAKEFLTHVKFFRKISEKIED